MESMGVPEPSRRAVSVYVPGSVILGLSPVKSSGFIEKEAPVPVLTIEESFFSSHLVSLPPP
jgi:hypothetical protein